MTVPRLIVPGVAGVPIGLDADHWPLMRTHPQREALIRSRNRFDVVPAGRRSGKTTDAIQRLLLGNRHLGGDKFGVLTCPPMAEPTFVYGAPTHSQAMRVSWRRFLAMVPPWAIASKNQNDQCIYFRNGARLFVVGMDAPKRIEGIPIDGVVLDEFADMKPEAWTSSVRPTLSTPDPNRPPGWAMFIGRPRGRNHFYVLAERAKQLEGWGVFAWPSWAVMSAKEIADARRDLDERSFRQEYGGEFIQDSGRAYYQYGMWNERRELRYDPSRELLIGFDFNRSPGVAVMAQEFPIEVKVLFCPQCENPEPGSSGAVCGICNYRLPFEVATGFIGEIWIDLDSNTRVVCQEILGQWGHHTGRVTCYGDATGGTGGAGKSRHTAAERSDWAIIEDYLSRRWPTINIDVPDGNPPERDRVVVVNSRLKNASDVVRVFVDRARCKHLADDFERVQLTEDGSEIDKDHDLRLTHPTDAAGYLLFQRYGNPNSRQGLSLEDL